MFRAKLLCQVVNHPQPGNEYVEFRAVYESDGGEENKSFAAATPDASFKMTINNPDLLGKIKTGEFFYFDVYPAPKLPAQDELVSDE